MAAVARKGPRGQSSARRLGAGRALPGDLVPAIWGPDPRVRAEREQARWRLHLVRHCSSLKQRVHAVLLTHGKPCLVSDRFRVRGPPVARAARPAGPLAGHDRGQPASDRRARPRDRRVRTRVAPIRPILARLCPPLSRILSGRSAAALGSTDYSPTTRRAVAGAQAGMRSAQRTALRRQQLRASMGS
jgi:hypothetical protein